MQTPARTSPRAAATSTNTLHLYSMGEENVFTRKNGLRPGPSFIVAFMQRLNIINCVNERAKKDLFIERYTPPST